MRCTRPGVRALRAAVDLAEKRRHDLPPLPPPSFDVAAAVKATLDASVIVERSEPGPGRHGGQPRVLPGRQLQTPARRCPRLDRDAREPADPRLRAVSRPWPGDYARMAKLFPTVSFVWLPTDHADYGDVTNMLKHITVATMDRLLCPTYCPRSTRSSITTSTRCAWQISPSCSTSTSATARLPRAINATRSAEAATSRTGGRPPR